MSAGRPRILCIDDEPQILEALRLNLGRRFEVHVAESGAAALLLLQQQAGFTVIISDMRMPGMDGLALLERARALAPEAVRILFTGNSEVGDASEAVRDGRIARFLTKPCTTPDLLAAVEQAAKQHRANRDGNSG